MTTIKVNELNENSIVSEQDAAAVKGGYKLKNVLISSYSVSGSAGGSASTFRGGVRVASGDLNGDGIGDGV